MAVVVTRSSCEFIGLSRDWLDVRVPLLVEDAEGWFRGVIAGEVADMPARSRTGYRTSYRAVQPDCAASVELHTDHMAARGWSLLSCSGASAEWGWNVAAADFPVAQANRIDVALDFLCSQEAFDRMFDDVRSISHAHGRRPHPVGESQWGRTCYVNYTGGRKGLDASPNAKMPQFVGKLYEKGKEMQGDPDWRRWEVATRPDKPIMKERAFNLEPSQILGSAPWSRAFLDSIGYDGAVKPGRASPFATQGPVSVEAKVAKKMSTLSHMGEQYGETVRDLVRMIGEDEARRLVELALFRAVVVQPDGREISGPALVRREAQQKWGDVFHHDLQRRIHDAGEGGSVH